ncbi:hypothetical protein M422DRAFT_785333 [Sphaerobolus stellatus SS14]|uniref:Uncharacterized protein n=1 Tax=Sphaerobolus stellatus (strain SS14) TaxID=990650 RepID=A0A0C9TAG2_SPHS4|nr:hypothetical protein M422DRAFT_785333 [Sphaerobolus stellatus SS14]
MRSFIVFGLVASSVFAAPIRRALTTPLESVPGVSQLVDTAGSVLGPVESESVAPILGQLEKLPLAGDTIASAANGGVGILSNVRRAPAITSLLENIPGVTELVNTAGSVLGPIESTGVAPVLGKLEALPVVGSTIASVANGAVGTVSNVRREPALTTPLESVPGVANAVDAAGSVLGPIESSEVAPILGKLEALPGVGSTIASVANGAVGTVSNVRREPQLNIVPEAVSGAIGEISGLANTASGVTGSIPVVGAAASPVISTAVGVANLPIEAANSVLGQGLVL